MDFPLPEDLPVEDVGLLNVEPVDDAANVAPPVVQTRQCNPVFDEDPVGPVGLVLLGLSVGVEGRADEWCERCAVSVVVVDAQQFLGEAALADFAEPGWAGPTLPRLLD